MTIERASAALALVLGIVMAVLGLAIALAGVTGGLVLAGIALIVLGGAAMEYHDRRAGGGTR